MRKEVNRNANTETAVKDLERDPIDDSAHAMDKSVYINDEENVSVVSPAVLTIDEKKKDLIEDDIADIALYQMDNT